MKFVEEFSLSVNLAQPLPIGLVPTGTRMYYDVIGGEIRGERVNGKVVGGGEWALIGPDGFLRIDVRLQAETTDAAFLYMQYFGLVEMSPVVQQALENNEATEFEDQYFFTNPRIETGDDRYAWLNSTFFVGEGRVLSGPGVEYRVWRPT